MKCTARLKNSILFLLIPVLALSGCSSGKQKTGSSKTVYAAPAFADVAFDKTAAVGQNGILIDLSHSALGYIGVSAEIEGKLKFQVLFGSSTYTYDLPSDGTPTFFCLQSGNGSYTFQVMKNTTENKYVKLYDTKTDVTLQDEFQPFLRPSQYVDYSAGSACVKKAEELASGASDQLDVVNAVYDYIQKNITYDQEKADTVQSGYLPDPDETLSTGKGICFDYAALATAMLRSEGIPVKMIFGYVTGDIYHAWNMFYTDETGWVAVKYEVSGDTWQRLDLTFSAGGVDEKFIADSNNYTEVYEY